MSGISNAARTTTLVLPFAVANSRIPITLAARMQSTKAKFQSSICLAESNKIYSSASNGVILSETVHKRSLGLPREDLPGTLADSSVLAKRFDELYLDSKDPQDHNDPNLHLFLDDEEIQHKEYLLPAINKLKKHPRPILAADRPWEGDRAQAWGSVIQEPSGLFRMWYFAMNGERRWDELDRGGYCYAESWDGVHWEKPDLGLFEFRGSRRSTPAFNPFDQPALVSVCSRFG